jgi:hypothetical protein
MKSFKSFLIEQENQKLPGMMAVYGSHSQPQKQKQSKEKLPGAQAVYGSHSQPKQQTKPDATTKFHAEPILSSAIHKEATESPPTQGMQQIKPHGYGNEEKIHAAHPIEDQDKGIRDYTYDSTDINRSLFRHHQTGEHPRDYKDFRGELGIAYSPSGNQYNAHEHIQRVDKVLDKHKIKQDTHVFSGLSRPPTEHFKGNTNKPVKVHFPAYTSTTTDFDKSLQFTENGAKKAVDHTPLNQDAPKSTKGKTRHVLKIRVPKGTPGGSVRNIAHYKSENEILLHRGMDMEIHHQPTVMNHPEHGHITVWHARVVGHNPAKL